MWDFLKRFMGYPVHATKTVTPEAPYKVETPVSSKCGCGRSPTGYCTGLHNLSDAAWAARQPVPPGVAAVVAKVKARKPKTAPVPVITASKPRKPREPKQ